MDEIEERLRAMEERLARLEARLAAPPPMSTHAQQQAPPLPPSADVPNTSNASAMVVEKLDGFSESDWNDAAGHPVAAIDTAEAAADPVGQPATPPDGLPVPAYYHATPPPLPKPGGFEQVVGLKWAGWFGAIVLVIGAALAIKFAYDQGWFGALPDVAKLLLMSLGGFGLLAAGEIVLRRIGAVASVGLYGAGVAVLFLVGYAGYEWYNVYAQTVAFVLMGAATVIGVLVAARADLVSIAVLSLVGGHLVPVVLGAESQSSVPLLSFLLLLQVLALVLCWWEATPKWWVLRSVSLAATAVWQLLLATSSRVPADTVAAVSTFAVIYWALYQAELALTSLRLPHLIGVPPSPPPTDTDTKSAPAVPPAAPGVLFSLLVTAQAVLVLLIAHDAASASVRGSIVVIAAAVCASAGLLFWLLRRETLLALSASLRAQAAALMVLAVPVTFDGQNIVFGWLALAVGFGLLAVQRRLPISAVAAAATWLLAVMALGLWVGASDRAHEVWLTLVGVAVKASVVVAAATMLVGHATASLIGRAFPAPPRPDPRPPSRELALSAEPFTVALHVVAASTWAIAAISQLPAIAGTIALLLHAWLMLGLSFWPPFRTLSFVAAGAALVAAIKWAVVDMLQERLSAADPTAAVFNRFLLLGVVIAASIAAIGWLRRSILLAAAAGDEPLRLLRSTLALLVVAIMTLALSVEIKATVDKVGTSIYRPEHAVHIGWTMLWTTAAVGLLLLDRRLFKPADETVGQVAGVAVVVVALKYLLVDAIAAAAVGRPAAIPVLINLQTLAGAVACGGLICVAAVWPHRSLRLTAQAVAAFLVLVAGSMEINRYAIVQTAAPTWIVRQAGWSIWWSIFAVLSVIAGFAARSVILRLVGLALFGLTLLKVVLVDLSGVGSGWRILSFVGLGLLLLGTSVLYGRYGQNLLKADEPSTA